MKKTDDILEQYDSIDNDYMYEHLGDYEVYVGRFIILFSYLEHDINLLISNILNERSDEIGYLVTTKMSMSDKIDMLDRFSTLEWRRSLPILQKVHDIIPKLKNLNAFRNIIAHANWSSMQEDGSVRVKTKVDEEKGVLFENRKITEKDICKKCHELDEVIGDLDAFEDF